MAELRKLGVRFTTEGIAGYKEDLRSAAREARRLSKETQLAMAELGSNATSTQRFKARMQGLDASYKSAQSRLKLLTDTQKDWRTGLSKTDKALKDNQHLLDLSSRNTERLRNNYEKMTQTLGKNHKQTKQVKKEWQESKKETSQLGKEVSRLEKDYKRYNKELDKLPSKVTGAKLSMAEFRNEQESLLREHVRQGAGLRDVADKFKRYGDATYNAGLRMKEAGQGLTRSITVPLLGLGVAAVKTGVEFEGQMSRVKAISGATEVEFSKLVEEAKRLGRQTIFTSREVALGMELMASAGFTATETLDGMSGVLSLAAVNGGDLALATESAVTTIRAFGLEAKDTAHVADVFARAAADSNAEVSDMGEAMGYVAPVAHSLGLSLEDTAAAIGLMSDAGIKGSKAGTTLRMALSRLAKPTSASAKLIKELGLNFFDAQGKMKPLDQIIRELKDSFKGMSKQQKVAALTTMFGQRAVAGMMTLIEQGPDKLGKFSNSLKHSAGAAEEMADTMLDNTRGKLKLALSALETAGIEIASSLAPMIQKAAEFVTNLANDFSKLSEEQQLNILKWAGIAAAAGPVLTLVGNLSMGLGTLFKIIAGGTRGVGALIAVMKGMPGLLSGTTTATTLFGEAMGVAGGTAGAGALTGGIAGLMPVLGALVGAGGLLVLGYSAWKAFGEEAWNTAQRIKRWGSDVGEETDKALREITELSEDGSAQLASLASGAEANVTVMAESFSKVGTSIEKHINERLKHFDELVKKMPEHLQGTAKEILESERQQLEKSREIIEDNNKRIAEIRSNASKHKRELTAFEGRQIADLMRASAKEYLNITIEDSNKRKEILTAMTGDVQNATQEQAEAWAKSLGKQRRLIASEGQKKIEQYKEQLDKMGLLNTDHGKKLVELYEQSEKATLDGIDAQISAIAQKYPELVKEINFQNGQAIIANTHYSEAMISNNRKIVQNGLETLNAQKDNVEEMAKDLGWLSSEATKSAETWNNLIYDPKTGKVDTNAREKVIEASKSAQTWNLIRFNLKEANLNSDAKAVIGEAAIANGYWKGMSWEEKEIVLNNEFSKTVYEALEDSQEWEKLSLEEKQLIVSSNTEEKMVETLAMLGKWEEFDVEIKNIQADNKDFISKIKDSKGALERFSKLDSGQKQLLLDNSEFGITLLKSEEMYKQFVSLSDDDKKLLLNNTEFATTLLTSEEMYRRFSELSDEEKQLMLNDTEFATGLLESEELWKEFQQLSDIEKRSVLTHEDNLVESLPLIQAHQDLMDSVIPEKESILHVDTNAGTMTPQAQNWNTAISKVVPETFSQAIMTTSGEIPTNQVQAWNETQSKTFSTNTKATMSTNAPRPTQLTKDWNDTQDKTRSTNTRATTSTNAASNIRPVKRWTSAVNEAPRSKRSVLETVYNKITNVFTNLFSPRHATAATGDRSFSGGNVWLGDGGRREPYLTPDGRFGVSSNQWEAHNLPRGTRIWPSRQAFRTEARMKSSLREYLNHIPKFAKGGTISNAYEGYTGLVGEAGPEIFQVAQGKVSITPITQSQRSQVLDHQKGTDMTETNQLLRQVIQLLAQGQSLVVDGKELGRTIYDEVDTMMSQRFNRKQVMRMGGD